VQAEMDSEVPKVDTAELTSVLGARASEPVRARSKCPFGTERGRLVAHALSAEEAIQRFQVGTWEAGVE